jgi:MoxR-like ATPase
MLAKARALLRGRVWVSEEDVSAVAAPALRHRLIFSYEGEASDISADDLIAQALRAAID